MSESGLQQAGGNRSDFQRSMMQAAFLRGHGQTRRRKAQLGFVRGTAPCHGALTKTLRVIAVRALAERNARVP
jgi:hypothetical protein